MLGPMGDDVAVLSLECGKANAMTFELLDTLERMLDGFERSPATAAVFTGYDNYFSGGLALTQIIDFGVVELRSYIEQFSRVLTRMLACEKPIVAAVNGHAIAGGCVLALVCDWRIATDDPAMRIGLTEAQLGVGLPAIAIEALRMSVPPASILPIAFEGALFNPRDALALGLVHDVAPAADLLARATAKAATLAALPAAAIAQIKRALRAPVLDTLARTADAETTRWLDTWFHPDAQSRLRAAVAKLGGRAPAQSQPGAPAVNEPTRRPVTSPLPRLKAHTQRDP
jgi:enoyl-CoA hydratase